MGIRISQDRNDPAAPPRVAVWLSQPELMALMSASALVQAPDACTPQGVYIELNAEANRDSVTARRSLRTATAKILGGLLDVDR